ncbi:hypothetical protein [Rhodoferax sp.]|uniref:hypothetical protein n=1 Tax=Rhodoferax sp. TaxID=50421 RepID=UPI00277965B8|nr:hypothetical protein [Rhodoferax sp.]
MLGDLHDELDAAVLAAYGWNDQPATDELLSRLMALNTPRAAEKRAGRVRWLRPEFQHPAIGHMLFIQELPDQYQQALQSGFALDTPAEATIGTATPAAVAAALPCHYPKWRRVSPAVARGRKAYPHP